MNVQKKVTPWKCMVAELGVGGGAQDDRKRSAGYDLIVVATLVDRLPNLGGLCRTCEVLGNLLIQSRFNLQIDFQILMAGF